MHARRVATTALLLGFFAVTCGGVAAAAEEENVPTCRTIVVDVPPDQHPGATVCTPV